MADRVVVNRLGELVRPVQEDQEYELQEGEQFVDREEFFSDEKKRLVQEVAHENAQKRVDAMAERYGLNAPSASHRGKAKAKDQEAQEEHRRNVDAPDGE